jgi:MmyB-like transcription regulator ligand binding domain
MGAGSGGRRGHRAYTGCGGPSRHAFPAPVDHTGWHGHKVRVGRLIMGDSPDTRQGRSLRRLLEEFRGRRSAEEAWRAARRLGTAQDEPERRAPERSREAGVDQDEMARLLGRPPREYAAIESGEVRMPPVTATALAVLLGLGEDERARLWELALGRAPAAVPAAPDPVWAGLVDDLARLDRAACLCDIAWNVVLANRPFHDLFPWAAPDGPRPETNLMRVIWREEARSGTADWERDWAWPIWAQVWGAYQLYPANATLQDLVHDIAADPGSASFWQQRDAYTVPVASPDVRTLVHPTLGRTRVAVATAIPESLKGVAYRFLYFHPLETALPS